MKKHLTLTFLLISATFVVAIIGLAQTRDEFKQKYGSPDAEGRYMVRQSIGLSVEYKQGRNPSEMIIKPLDSNSADTSNSENENSPRKVMLSDEAEEVLEELVPTEKRGKKRLTTHILQGCTFIDRAEYELVTINIQKRCERRGGGTYLISVRWKE